MSFGLGIGSKGRDIASDSLDTDPEPTPPPLPKPKTYYVYMDGKKVGGNTVEMIGELFSSQKIDKDTLVWRAGMSEWKPLQAVKELWKNIGIPPEL